MGKHNDTGNDQFYTKPDVANDCIAQILEHVPEERRLLFIEPAAGMGSFLHGLPAPWLAYDIEPNGLGIVQQDWLTLRPVTDPSTTVVLGNPPFGHAGNLAVKFFNHAAKFAHTIAFILPRSFRKFSVQNRLNLQYHLVHESEPPQDGFYTADRVTYKNVQPVVFQIWVWRAQPRTKVVCTTNPYFVFCKRGEATAAIRRAGARAGELVSIETSATASTLFVKPCDGVTNDEMIQAIKRANLTEHRNNTASVRAVSASEMHLKLSGV